MSKVFIYLYLMNIKENHKKERIEGQNGVKYAIKLNTNISNKPADIYYNEIDKQGLL